MGVKVFPELVETSQRTCGPGLPAPAAVNVTLLPAGTVTFCGSRVTFGGDNRCVPNRVDGDLNRSGAPAIRVVYTIRDTRVGAAEWPINPDAAARGSCSPEVTKVPRMTTAAPDRTTLEVNTSSFSSSRKVRWGRAGVTRHGQMLLLQLSVSEDAGDDAPTAGERHSRVRGPGNSRLRQMAEVTPACLMDDVDGSDPE